MDELLEVLHGVDDVMRRRHAEHYPWHGEPYFGDPVIALVSGQLPALSGLGALGHLDLKVVRVDQVLAGHAEARGGDLLDRAPPPVAIRVASVPRRILAALSGVGLAPDPVHGDGQRLMSLLADGAVGHRARGEALEDRLHGLDLLDRDGLRGVLELDQPAERGQAPILVVDELRVLPVDLVLSASGSVLELEDGVRIKEVVLAVAPPLVLAAPVEIGRAHGPLREGPLVAAADLLLDGCRSAAGHAGSRARGLA